MKSRKDFVRHLMVILSIAVVLIVVFFYVYLPFTTNHGETILVPDLKGKTLVEVENILNDLNLRFQVSDSTYVEGTVASSILSQNPVAGSEVKKNRKIYVGIAAQSPPMVLMPELKQLSLRQAEMVLKSSGLVLQRANMVPGPYATLVLRQYVNGREIASDTKVSKGTKVVLDVSNGDRDSEEETPDSNN